MPKASTAKVNESEGSGEGPSRGVECPTCKKSLSRKYDLPRHMKLHLQDKSSHMYRCEFPGCPFENLQLSNLQTHMRTHTQCKDSKCPDCDWANTDPASLTKHRAKAHGYVPDRKKSRGPKKTRVQVVYAPEFESPSPSSSSSSSPLNLPLESLPHPFPSSYERNVYPVDQSPAPSSSRLPWAGNSEESSSESGPSDVPVRRFDRSMIDPALLAEDAARFGPLQYTALQQHSSRYNTSRTPSPVDVALHFNCFAARNWSQ